MDIYNNISDGKYQPEMEYPRKPGKPYLKKGHTSEDVLTYHDMLKDFEIKNKTYNDIMSEWRKENSAAFALFRIDAIEYCGLTGHPKADKAFSLAYDRAGGTMSEILENLEELTELLA